MSSSRFSRFILIIAAVLWLLGVVLALTGRGNHADAGPLPTLAMAKDKTLSDGHASVGSGDWKHIDARPLRGFALNFHHTRDVKIYLQAIDEIKAMGFDSIEVVTPMYQTHGATTDIKIIVGPGKSPSPQDLELVLKYAKKQGFRTALMPIVLLADPRGNEWRGKIRPENWGVWWSAYEDAMDGFIKIANATDVDVLSVGSELLTTEKQVEPWARFIRKIRSRFKGKLSYSTNWDHYQTPVFWSQLDMIGINGYWNLQKDIPADQPVTHEKLVERWEDIQSQLLEFGESQGKPILLTEIGYPSLPWGLKDPWNYVNGKKATSDVSQQAQGYSAFLSVWKTLLRDKPDTSKAAGVFFYKWDPYYNGGDEDTGYGVRNKPAFDLLKNWVRGAAIETQDSGQQR
jgi:hypothetical protein